MVVRAKGRAALAALLVGIQINVLELLEGQVARDVDRLGDRAVHVFLEAGLDIDMRARRDLVGGRKILRQGALARGKVALQAIGVVLDRVLLVLVAMADAHAARVGEGEDRFEAARNVAGEERDGAGRRDRDQVRIADAVLADAAAQLLGQLLDKFALQIAFAVEQREGALLDRQVNRGVVGGVADGAHDLLGDCERGGRAVAGAQHAQRVGQAGDAEAHAALAGGFLALFFEREVGDLDDIVEHAHGDADGLGHAKVIDLGMRAERIAHKLGQVDRAEQAGAIRR